MKKIDTDALDQIRNWIYRNGRRLEVAVWQCEFEGGSREAVIEAMKPYQNEDGGMGHALEADNWNPASSPYTTMIALQVLDRIGWNDPAHPVLQGILKFFESGKYYQDGLWLFSIPSNDDYPRAPWWTYDEERNKTESLGITVLTAALLMKYTSPESVLHQKAMEIAAKLLETLESLAEFGDMGMAGYCTLLETIKERGMEELFAYEKLAGILSEKVYRSIERDTEKWMYYGMRPSTCIHAPESLCYKGNEEIIEKELDYLIETRQEGGVWSIPWTWFDLMEKYAKEFAISENWWKAEKAIEKLVFLRNFARI